MRYMRSILCAGLAMVAMAVCASMPAAADVPPEITIMTQPVTGVDYPAPAVAIVSQDVAALPSEVPNVEGDGGSRSSTGNTSFSSAEASFAVEAYRHIDPDIAG